MYTAGKVVSGMVAPAFIRCKLAHDSTAVSWSIFLLLPLGAGAILGV